MDRQNYRGLTYNARLARKDNAMEPREVSEYLDDRLDYIIDSLFKGWADENHIDHTTIDDNEREEVHQRFWASSIGSEILLWKHKIGTEVTEQQLTFATLARKV